MCIANIFPQSVTCVFIFLIVSFKDASMNCAFCVLPKQSLPNPKSQGFYLMISSRHFIVTGFILRFTIHFEFIFIYGVRSW